MAPQFSILIVEDDVDTRRNLEDILLLDGYRIHTSSHCLPALDFVEREPFDAVIIDWRLPDGSGGDLIPLIHRQLPDVPVIVVTGVREFETPVEALRCGAYDFLTKPINADMLRAVVRRLVERKSHLSELEQTQHRLLEHERLAAIGEMVTGLAHESRNAFQRSHACLAELSLDLEGMPASLKLVHKIQRALDDVNRLLEEVRGYAAPVILKRRPASLVEAARDAWQDLVEAEPERAQPELTVHAQEDFPATCFVDIERIRRVIRNLLENAWSAVPRAGGKIRVECHLAPNAKCPIAVSVADNGPGIDEADWQRVFKPFVTTKTHGTGLGLAICDRIVEAHGGTLELAAAELGGARFTIRLPADRDARPSQRIDASARE